MRKVEIGFNFKSDLSCFMQPFNFADFTIKLIYVINVIVNPVWRLQWRRSKLMLIYVIKYLRERILNCLPTIISTYYKITAYPRIFPIELPAYTFLKFLTLLHLFHPFANWRVLLSQLSPETRFKWSAPFTLSIT